MLAKSHSCTKLNALIEFGFPIFHNWDIMQITRSCFEHFLQTDLKFFRYRQEMS